MSDACLDEKLVGRFLLMQMRSKKCRDLGGDYQSWKSAPESFSTYFTPHTTLKRSSPLLNPIFMVFQLKIDAN